jgi:hypothetical protein
MGPANVYAGRSVVFPYSCGTPGGGSNPAYSVAGSETISAEALDSAHVVPDRDVVVAGDTVTFTVQVSWSSDVHVFGTWRWVPDTTTNTSTLVGTCWHSVSCKVVVRERGHTEVDDIRVEYGAITLAARSPVIMTATPELILTCTPANVVRGDAVTCEASASPAGERLAMTGWTFTSTRGDVITRTADSVANTAWSGALVIDGRIDASGTVAGQAKSASANVTVTARDWSQKTVYYTVQDETPNGLNPQPDSAAELGQFRGYADASFGPPDRVAQVAAGPNQGMFYPIEVPVAGLARIWINRVALADGSDFYNLQPASAQPPQCSQADVVPFLPLAEDHEGTTLSPTSHAGVFRDVLNQQVPQPTESVTALNDIGLFLDRVTSAAAPGIAAAVQDSKDMSQGGTVPPIHYCLFTYF